MERAGGFGYYLRSFIEGRFERMLFGLFRCSRVDGGEVFFYGGFF